MSLAAMVKLETMVLGFGFSFPFSDHSMEKGGCSLGIQLDLSLYL